MTLSVSYIVRHFDDEVHLMSICGWPTEGTFVRDQLQGVLTLGRDDDELHRTGCASKRGQGAVESYSVLVQKSDSGLAEIDLTGGFIFSGYQPGKYQQVECQLYLDSLSLVPFIISPEQECELRETGETAMVDLFSSSYVEQGIDYPIEMARDAHCDWQDNRQIGYGVVNILSLENGIRADIRGVFNSDWHEQTEVIFLFRFGKLLGRAQCAGSTTLGRAPVQ